jgi:hypothetical protein
MTLLDTIFGVAIFVLVFTGLFAGFRLAIGIIADSKAKTGALALVSKHMEIIKSFPYDTLGTAGGIPSGSIPQIATTTLNVTRYTIRTLIQYIDQPQDGLGVADTNGITADAKQVKVEVSWQDRDIPRSLSSVTVLSPLGIESIAGGGTLRVNVFDALADPIAAAQVRVENASLVPAVDVTTFTNSSGVVLFPGAASGGSYKITVTKSGYSTDQTYDADVSNPNPNPGHLTVAVGQTTTGSFAIDTLGTLIVRTFSPVEEDSFSDTFDDTSDLTDLTNTEVAGGALTLLLTGEDYAFSGTALSTTTAPSYLSQWNTLSFADTTNASTTIRYRVLQVDGAGVATLVPDIALPGNSAGYVSSPVPLSSLSVGSYPRLAIEATLETIDASTTPEVFSWELSYSAGPTPLPNIPFSIQGAKTIGTTGGGLPISKFSSTGDTGAGSSQTFSNMEWDAYTVSQDPDVTNLDVIESCQPQPLSLSPGATVYSDLTLAPKSTHSLLMAFRSSAGALLPGVSVSLTRPGYSEVATSSACGQTYFGGLSSGTYVVDATLSGYQAASTTVDVSGPTAGSLTLTL